MNPAEAEELRLLRRLWDVVWNQTGSMDGGEHALYDWADEVKINAAGSAVEDFYATHGFPAIEDEE